MTSDHNNNSGCLFPFGDDFLPILLFFLDVNQPNPGASGFDDEDEEDEEQDEDEGDLDDIY
jgi:hypothetical protein